MFIEAYTRILKGYDRDLFAGKNQDGVTCIFRKVRRENYVGELDGMHFSEVIEGKQFVFALTDTWGLNGRPRAWGLDHVLTRVKQIDAQARAEHLDEMDAHNERVDKSKARHLKNEMEAFWSHERRRFAKATDDILTHSLSKDEPKKRLRDRRIKNA